MKPVSKMSLIKLVHVGKRELALKDETYRAMLLAVTGCESSRECNIGQLLRLVEHMRAKGFAVRAPRKAKAAQLADEPQARKIRALWLELHRLGEVRDPSEGAMARYVKRQTRVERLEWLNTYQASDVIEALKKWLLRVDPDTLCV